MKAPAMPPPAAPMSARSRSERLLRRAFCGFAFWGFKEVEAKERWELDLGLGFGEDMRVVVRWVKREVKSVRDCGWGLEEGEGRPREAEIRVSMAKLNVLRTLPLISSSGFRSCAPIKSSEGKWRRRKLEGRHRNGASSLVKDGAVLPQEPCVMHLCSNSHLYFTIIQQITII